MRDGTASRADFLKPLVGIFVVLGIGLIRPLLARQEDVRKVEKLSYSIPSDGKCTKGSKDYDLKKLLPKADFPLQWPLQFQFAEGSSSFEKCDPDQPLVTLSLLGSGGDDPVQTSRSDYFPDFWTPCDIFNVWASSSESPKGDLRLRVDYQVKGAVPTPGIGGEGPLTHPEEVLLTISLGYGGYRPKMNESFEHVLSGVEPFTVQEEEGVACNVVPIDPGTSLYDVQNAWWRVGKEMVCQGTGSDVPDNGRFHSTMTTYYPACLDDEDGGCPSVAKVVCKAKGDINGARSTSTLPPGAATKDPSEASSALLGVGSLGSVIVLFVGTLCYFACCY